jgi:hypothetical protein
MLLLPLLVCLLIRSVSVTRLVTMTVIVVRYRATVHRLARYCPSLLLLLRSPSMCSCLLPDIMQCCLFMVRSTITLLIMFMVVLLLPLLLVLPAPVQVVLLPLLHM